MTFSLDSCRKRCDGYAGLRHNAKAITDATMRIRQSEVRLQTSSAKAILQSIKIRAMRSDLDLRNFS